MPRPPKRQPRVPISVSLMHPDWVRVSRAAGMLGMTLSEFGRAAIKAKVAETFGEAPSAGEQLKAAS